MRPLPLITIMLCLCGCSNADDERSSPGSGGANTPSGGSHPGAGEAGTSSGGSQSQASGGVDTAGGSETRASGGETIGSGGHSTGGISSGGSSSTGGRIVEPSLGGNGPVSPCEEYCVKWMAYDCNLAVDESNVYADEDDCLQECGGFPTSVDGCRLDSLDFVQLLSNKQYCRRAAKTPESPCKP